MAFPTSHRPIPHAGWQAGTQYPALFVVALDGDTIVVEWLNPIAERHWTPRVRLVGIDAPEIFPTTQPGAVAAQLALRRLCAATPLMVRPTRRWPDLYGRMLARVTANGLDVSTELLKGGWVSQYNPRLRRAQKVRRLLAMDPAHLIV
jgi:endonuclease YncB( thermonuclease family)